jgi:hypothetical protein
VATSDSRRRNRGRLLVTKTSSATNRPQACVRGKWFFLASFIFACFLFWWLPSLLFRAVVHQADEIENETIAISVLALFCFITGYLIPAFGRPAPRISEPWIDACTDFSYRATVVLALPVLILSMMFWRSHASQTYGYVAIDAIPLSYQAILYTHLFFGFMYFGAAHPEKQGWRRIASTSILVILPRLIISLHWGRFFLAQAVLPALLIAIARGWIRLSPKRLIQTALLALVILFLPAMTRGDFDGGQTAIVEWFSGGSSLRLMQTDADLNLNGYCNPLFVSLTAKSIPYALLNLCVLDLGSQKNVPATLDRILTINNPVNSSGIVSGTGSNYLLELYLFGGSSAVYVGSFIFGFICRRFIGWIGARSLFAGIWAECLTRTLLAPRGNLSYALERIPSLVLTTLLVIVIVWVMRLLRMNQTDNSSEQITA